MMLSSQRGVRNEEKTLDMQVISSQYLGVIIMENTISVCLLSGSNFMKPFEILKMITTPSPSPGMPELILLVTCCVIDFLNANLPFFLEGAAQMVV